MKLIATQSIEELAATLYDSRMPYHNFGHAVNAAAAGNEICKHCKQEGITIDPKVVYVALLFHDAGYHEDHTMLGFDTKEAYSAELARRYLTERDYEPEFINQVTQAILCTHKDATPVSNEDKAVRSADIDNVGRDYDNFLANSRKFYAEVQLLSGGKVGWEEYKQLSKQILTCYLQDNLTITKHDADFVRRGRANLERLMIEPG